MAVAIASASTIEHPAVNGRERAVPRSSALLVSELFPPAVGGSAVLLHGIYSRLVDTAVSVLADQSVTYDSASSGPHGLTVHAHPIATRAWGVSDVRGLRHHVRVARTIKALCPRDGIVHCARALPEGVATLVARVLGGPRYACWAHGEDLVTARTSRELEMLTRAVFRGASAAFANSRNTAAMLSGMGLPVEKIHVVHPAVDTDRFHPGVDGRAIRARHTRHQDDILFVSVGRLQRRKGHDVAIEAMATLRPSLPHARYLIVGDGDERARLERLVIERNLSECVTFAGTVPNDDLPAYFAACDVFLLPNRVDEDGDIEGFGIVFLEAAGVGKPVIGGDSGGVPEAVERDVTGLLVDGASVAAVAGAMRALAESPERRHALGRAGRVRARERFSWQRAATLVEAVQHCLAGVPDGAVA